MTVKELIKKLSKCSEDAEVLIPNDSAYLDGLYYVTNIEEYDDGTGYTRSKDKNIRTACAIREATYADFYKEISDTMRKYQKIGQIIKDHDNDRLPADYWYIDKIKEVIEDRNDK